MLALIFQSFQPALIIGDYYINTESYAAHCENKANVQMHCNGKCQMMKKLKQEEEKDQKNPQRKADNNKEIVFYLEIPFQFNVIVSAPQPKSYGLLPVLSPMARPHDIFHPPIA